VPRFGRIEALKRLDSAQGSPIFGAFDAPLPRRRGISRGINGTEQLANAQHFCTLPVRAPQDRAGALDKATAAM
jgi:hypothetical protein